MTNVMSCETAIPADRARAIKARQQAMWASGDFAVIGATLQIVGPTRASTCALHLRRDVHAPSSAGRGRTDARVQAGWPYRPRELDADRLPGATSEADRRVRPRPAGRSVSLLWGTDAHVRELFPGAAQIQHMTRMFAFRYRSPDHWVGVFRTFYGPTYTAFLALDADGQAALKADLVALLRSHDLGRGDGLLVPGEYLEIVITK